MIEPLNFRANKETQLNSSIVDLKKAVKLLQDFFFYILFDFDIKLIYNAIPLTCEGLYKIFVTNLKFS